MNKNNKLCLSILLCVLLVAIVALTACNNTSYTLTFETNGGTPIQAIQFKKGNSVTVPTTTKEYFTFSGWYADETLTTPFEQFNKMPDEDVTVYAKWTAGESGKIVFEANGGILSVKELTGVVGQSVSEPEAPTKEGYVFAGWYRDAELTNLYVFGTFQSGTTTLYAKWSKNANFNYITYVLNGVATEVPVQSGTKATESHKGDDVVCTWYTDEQFTTEYNFNATVTKDITLYGLMYSKGLTFNGGTVTGYSGNSKQIFIPEKHNGQQITAIGAGAFYAQDIQYVTLPHTVTSIGEVAFYGCEYLVNINVTADINAIGSFAFANCARMITAMDLSNLSVIQDSTFANCSLLSQVIYGDKLTEIGDSAFINCAKLASADIPNSVTAINAYAFAGSGINSINIPSSLAQWGVGVVKGCSKLTAISGGNQQFAVNSDNGTLINDSTLLLCLATSEYTLPTGIKSIAPYAFYGSESITRLDVTGQSLTQSSLEGMRAIKTLIVKDFDANNAFLAYWFGASTAQKNSSSGLYVPDSLTAVTFTDYSFNDVPNYAFYGCNGLTTISGIGEVATIGEYAYGYTALTSFNVVSSVTSIANTAFRGASTLQEITVDNGNADYSSYDGALYNKTGSNLIYVPEGKTSILFAQSVTAIDSGALYQSRVSELTVPGSVETIAYGALENMSRISSLTVPFIGESVDGSNNYMLYVFGATVTLDKDGKPTSSAGKCPASLTSITVSGKVTDIPDYAFAFCATVSQIDCGNGYTSIGTGAFYSTALRLVTIPDTVTVIGKYAYFGCENAESVVIGKGVTNVGEWSFAAMTALEKIVFEEGDNPLTIGDCAFLAYSYMDSNRYIRSLSYVTEIVFSNNIVTIGASAFCYVGYRGILARNNTLIKSDNTTYSYLSIEFDVEHSRLETIGEAAFNQSGIYSVTLPASIKTIDAFAFYACFVLDNVTIGSADNEATNLTLIDGEAFGVCFDLNSVTIHKTVSNRTEVPTLGYTDNGYGVFYGTSTLIYVPKGCAAIYTAVWGTSQVNSENIVEIKEA